MNKPTYEELAAQVEVLRNHLIKLNDVKDEYDAMQWESQALALAESTPSQCLAEIRAESAYNGYIACLRENGLAGVPTGAISEPLNRKALEFAKSKFFNKEPKESEMMKPTHTATGRKISAELTAAQAHFALWLSQNTDIHSPEGAGIVEAQQLSYKLEMAFAAGAELKAEVIKGFQAEAAKKAIHALFEAGNCPQYENGAGDGYIECGDALNFADKYTAKILSGEVKL
jgi:hypothetical protein